LVCGNRPDALRDRHTGRGPLAGLDSALQYGLAHGIAGLLLVPVDMPLLDRNSVLALSQTGQPQQRVTHYQGHPLPMYCPVTAATARLCEQLLQDDNPRQRALHVFAHAARALTLAADTAARTLDNINTPDDWQQLLAAQQD
jgi:molybdopterin-guanine dinucleotide biosynthesis protein A